MFEVERLFLAEIFVCIGFCMTRYGCGTCLFILPLTKGISVQWRSFWLVLEV